MSERPRFSNRQNQRHQIEPGKVLFESRSVAVTAIVLCYDSSERKVYALVGERGPAVDFSGTWCLVCGYLDWDESLDDAVRREVFEESGLDLRALEASGEAIVPALPIFVQSDPQANRQNVTARFVVELKRRVEPTNAHAEPGEVNQVRWIEIEPEALAALPWAFNHDRILGELASFYQQERRAGSLDEGSTRRYVRAQIEGRYPYR
jgi:8-oxo-dGTP pyrophosphatase MutT (NUDIX family)